MTATGPNLVFATGKFLMASDAHKEPWPGSRVPDQGSRITLRGTHDTAQEIRSSTFFRWREDRRVADALSFGEPHRVWATLTCTNRSKSCSECDLSIARLGRSGHWAPRSIGITADGGVVA